MFFQIRVLLFVKLLSDFFTLLVNFPEAISFDLENVFEFDLDLDFELLILVLSWFVLIRKFSFMNRF